MQVKFIYCYISGFINQKLSPTKSTEFHALDSSNFTIVDKESVNFFKDVHSWKWYFAFGKRMMIVGVGVSTGCLL